MHKEIKVNNDAEVLGLLRCYPLIGHHSLQSVKFSLLLVARAQSSPKLLANIETKQHILS